MFPFRHEALNARADRLTGDVGIFVPVSWQATGYLLAAAVAIALGFLGLGQYARIETVAGTVVPDKGLAAIVPPKPGILYRMQVRDGSHVDLGAPLAFIQSEGFLVPGGSAGSETEAALSRQIEGLEAKGRSDTAAIEAERQQNDAKRRGLRGEIDEIQAQAVLQRKLIATASEELAKAREIATRGFISRREVQAREDTLLGRQQQLSQLQQALASRRSALEEAERGELQIAARGRALRAEMKTGRAQVDQQAVRVSSERSYALRAPLAGLVTAVAVRPGQSVSNDRPVMTIVPDRAILRAELSVPASAIGFVAPGQQVRVAVDTFPYDRFGTINGRITVVAASAVERRSATGETKEIYPVTVELDQGYVTAFGQRHALTPGMSLTARIVTRKQSFLAWLFQPLFAVRGR